jgi:nicotinate-nucleotide pyrophosphorylase (carboxylating)
MSAKSKIPYTRNIESYDPDEFSDLVELALKEDSVTLGPANDIFKTEPDFLKNKCANLYAKEDGILCGIDMYLYVFEKVAGPKIKKNVFFTDGQNIVKGDLICKIIGPAALLLKAERPALNFLGFLSGIANKTNKLITKFRKKEMEYYGCSKVEDLPHKIHILDTRKTLPGYRKLSKYAVFIGGGTNHRLNLSEMGIIKENHIRGFGSIKNAIKNFRIVNPDVPFEIEVRTIDEVRQVLSLKDKPIAIMLDNMDLETLKKCIQLIPDSIASEASGGYNASNINVLIGIGVDCVSMGAITKDPGHFDFSVIFTE